MNLEQAYGTNDAYGTNSEQLQEVYCFKHLWSQVDMDGGCEKDIGHKMVVGYKAWEGSTVE